MSNGHAVLSPSSAHRWLVCTPSARIEASRPDRSSEAAEEGTLAHAIAELLLREELLEPDDRLEPKLLALQENELYSEEMLDHVYEYVDFVAERFHAAQEPILFLEELLDMSTYAPDCEGTGDVVIVAENILEVIDLKYGKGVPVSAVNNPQLKLYGVGAYLRFGFLFGGIHTVRLTIYQPRIDNFSSWDISTDDLLRWAQQELRPLARTAWAGGGELVAGDHCRFCKIAATCRANAELNMATAKKAFAPAAELEPQEVAEILKGALRLENWLTAVKDYALDQALNHGAKWPGLKLVEGTARRRISDEHGAAGTLRDAAGLTEEQIYKPRALKGIGDLEKLIGKKAFADLLTKFIIKPQGKPTLAPLEDKRAAWHSAEAAAATFTKED